MRPRGELRNRTIGYASTLSEAGLAALGVPSPAALLILGHMRSGTTLLLHLLLTNPEISAPGERGAMYASRGDFARLAIETRVAHASPFRRLRYAADQVNHNWLIPNCDLLQDSRVRAVFILRQPEATIASILELYRVYYRQPWTVPRAVDYYVERLAGLMKLGGALHSKRAAALISYETLTDQPERTLEALRLFLGLREAFSKSYQTYRFTRWRGDPGPGIAAGRILPGKMTSNVDLPQPQLGRAKNAYLECAEALAQFALPVSSDDTSKSPARLATA